MSGPGGRIDRVDLAYIGGSATTPGVLPLPAGAATSAKQDSQTADLDAIKTNTTGAATAAKQDATNTALAAIDAALGSPFQTNGLIGNVSFGAVQSGVWTVALGAGAAVIGHVIVDTVPLPPNAAQEAGGNLAAVAANTAGAAKDSSLASIKTALGNPLQAGTVTTQESAMSGQDADGLIDSLNKITLLLMSIDMRLQELPLRMNSALNAGAVMNYRSADDFPTIREDLANLIYNNN